MQKPRSVDGDPGLEPAAGDDEAHFRQHDILVTVDAAGSFEGQHRERQEREQQVVEGGEDPHVPQRLAEDAGRLLLDELGRGLEAGDAEHRGRVAVEDAGEQVALDEVPGDVDAGEVRGHVGPERVGVLHGVAQREAAEQRERQHVQEEDAERDGGALGDAHERERGEDEEQRHGAGHDGHVQLRAEVPQRRRAGHDARGQVRDDAERGGHRRRALGRRVEQHVVRAAVERDGGHGLLVDEMAPGGRDGYRRMRWLRADEMATGGRDGYRRTRWLQADDMAPGGRHGSRWTTWLQVDDMAPGGRDGSRWTRWLQADEMATGG
ncbi:unnamed protein product [Phytophthora fragariaefolia]|uniref:Unnamed protein product n=1 Tax=Phytophthora fragariaefolia TaxID=1490495 RepID=A0A9W7CR17_9STRA|nr:unnamed protein product [Phytophthora fragariaefolia]